MASNIYLRRRFLDSNNIYGWQQTLGAIAVGVQWRTVWLVAMDTVFGCVS